MKNEKECQTYHVKIRTAQDKDKRRSENKRTTELYYLYIATYLFTQKSLVFYKRIY